MAAAIRGKRTVPCVLTIVPPADKETGKEENATMMHLYRAGKQHTNKGWAMLLGRTPDQPALHR